nr:reverse transcriptase domain-containing protein [Tanacetum cinerariifolium]
MLSMAWQFKHHPHTLRSQSKPGRAKSCTISGAIHETATISPVKTKSITIKLPKLLFQHDKRERRFTPTGFFDTDPFTWSKRRLRGRVVEFKEAPNRDESKSGRRWESWRKPSSTSRSPPGKKGERLQTPPNGQMPIYANSYSQSNASMTYSQPSSYSFLTQGDYTGCVTSFVRLIEDHPLPDGLKMPYHKRAMPESCHMLTYTLKDSIRIWWTGQKVVKQNKRRLAPKRNEVACKEVDKLTMAVILWEFKYETWVANPVMVKKSAKGWRMGVDFTDINKACLKDYYPLPEINRTMESLSGFQLKYVLDAYKGYHQLQMAEGDKGKTTFFTKKGVFCYQNMPFGLKNAGETYQRLVDKVFNDQIGRNLKGYNDDMVIKSASEEDMLMDIQETFDRIRSINMKLNQKKCSFGVKEGPFLGQLITKHGIKANHSNVKEITDLKPPSTLKEIQILKGKLAALS